VYKKIKKGKKKKKQNKTTTTKKKKIKTPKNEIRVWSSGLRQTKKRRAKLATNSVLLPHRKIF